MSKEIEGHVLQLFEIKTFLGSGAYGHVWRVTERSSGREYALKKIFDAFQNEVDAQRTYREITILPQLDHENVVRLHSVIRAKNSRDLYLLFESMQTDLHSILGEHLLGPTHLRFVAYQLAKVLKYLHSAQLIHRDLKSSNILINSNCEIKLCDFGLVRSLTREEQCSLVLSEDVATRWYRSPELLLGARDYGKATDLWSVGCILAELVTGEPIFPGSSTLDQLEKILEFTGLPSRETLDSINPASSQTILTQLKTRRRPFKSYFPECDRDLKQLILRLLQFDPSKRITPDQMLALPCLQQFRGKTQESICHRFITTEVDDNVRLDLDEYRRLIYRDIERRYPAVNKITPMPRIYRTHHSLKARSNPETIHRGASNSLAKLERRNEEAQDTPVSRLYKKPKQDIRRQVKQCGKENKQVDKTNNETKIYKRRLRGNPWHRSEGIS